MEQNTQAEREGGWVCAYLGLGSNLGDRIANLRRAARALETRPGIRVRRFSPVYETPAHTRESDEAQPPYLNAVAFIETNLGAEDLLETLHAIEAEVGRRRVPGQIWAPRTLDVDVLLYDAATLTGPTLQVPHPRLGQRRFVLQPLADLAPDVLVPAPFRAHVRTLLVRCEDSSPIRRTAHTLRCSYEEV